MDVESAHHKACGHMRGGENLSFCTHKFGSFIPRLVGCFSCISRKVAFHVFPARMREMVGRLLLIRQRQGLFRRYSGLKFV